MTTYQNKSLIVNCSTTNLTTTNGSRADNVVLYYKSNTNITWTILDASLAAVDVSGATLEFKIAETYNATPLVNVADSDFDKTSASSGIVSCVVDMDNAAILTLIDDASSVGVVATLWMTVGGINYCLANFSLTINNTIF